MDENFQEEKWRGEFEHPKGLVNSYDQQIGKSVHYPGKASPQEYLCLKQNHPYTGASQNSVLKEEASKVEKTNNAEIKNVNILIRDDQTKSNEIMNDSTEQVTILNKLLMKFWRNLLKMKILQMKRLLLLQVVYVIGRMTTTFLIWCLRIFSIWNKSEEH